MRIAGTLIPARLRILYVLSLASVLLCWPFTVIGAAMQAEGAVTAGELQMANVRAAAFLLWPLLPLVGVTGSFFALRRRRAPLAYTLAAIAVLPVVFLVLAVVAGALNGFGIIHL